MRQWLLVLVGFAAFAALPPQASLAVIGGQPDGNAHPNVGLIATFDELGGGIVCTGTLAAPSTVLSNAHCVRDDPDFPPALEYQVSFIVAGTLESSTRRVCPEEPHRGQAGSASRLDVGGECGDQRGRRLLPLSGDRRRTPHLSAQRRRCIPGLTPAPIAGPVRSTPSRPARRPWRRSVTASEDPAPRARGSVRRWEQESVRVASRSFATRWRSTMQTRTTPVAMGLRVLVTPVPRGSSTGLLVSCSASRGVGATTWVADLALTPVLRGHSSDRAV